MTDREGLDGLTIRAVAEGLAVPQMSLYACFASRSELLDMMYAEVAGRMFAAVDCGTWQEDLVSVGESIRAMLGEHPNWAPLLTRSAPPLVSQPRERLLAKLESAGMSAEQAFTALSSVILGSLGLMLVEFAMRTPTGASGLDERLESLKGAVTDEPDFKVTRQALQRLEHFRLGTIHEQSLELLLKGFEAWTVGSTSTA